MVRKTHTIATTRRSHVAGVCCYFVVNWIHWGGRWSSAAR